MNENPRQDAESGMRLDFDAEGHLTLTFGLMSEGWREAVCCECGEPIRWVLDMFSFTTNDRGGYSLGHAWCLWTPNGFTEARRRAVRLSEGRPSDG